VRWVRDIGPYGHSEKLNILVAITGEDAAPGQSAHRWADTWRNGGTTIVRFIAFIARILQDIGPGTPQNFHVFTMDNLNTHRNLLVQQMIHAAGHRCVFRAPYYPVDSPIEHLFNSIQVDLSLAMYRIFTPQQLKDEFLASLRRFREFVPFFEKVGMR
jgi:transposase